MTKIDKAKKFIKDEPEIELHDLIEKIMIELKVSFFQAIKIAADARTETYIESQF